jgi:hypothetical protein
VLKHYNRIESDLVLVLFLESIWVDIFAEDLLQINVIKHYNRIEFLNLIRVDILSKGLLYMNAIYLKLFIVIILVRIVTYFLALF